ncbi:hypothetical protein GCM10007857_43370 [Bradyrhizobium iriomotense]|uniref:Uncharacterized protein n=1 Tax=Bradyrhizobium iriomotense TaxID=441950 RepID=A0ABQ6B1B7_9BRAD|nr:hypothetical protein GCM10007857_43370 [Bradyrhizobium iriomotense]
MNEDATAVLMKTWDIASQKVFIALLAHPFGASKMTVIDLSRAVRFASGIDAKDNPTDLAPVCTLIIGVQQAPISDKMREVIGRHDRIGRSQIRYIGFERCFLHGSS